MQTVFVLSQEHLPLAQAEAEALAQRQGVRRRALLTLAAPPQEGLALTRSAHELLFTTTSEHLLEAMASFAWPPGSFAVRAHGIPLSERDLAAPIWRRLAEEGVPRVDLERPENEFVLFGVDGTLFVTRTLWRNAERFDDRRAHLRPRNHPTGLHPKLARTMVNLAGPATTILDPFCGAGGILIEGALIGRRMTGWDIDPEQLRRAEENLAYYGCSAALVQRDATTLNGTYDALVTDLPLGRNAKLAAKRTTYPAFFRAASHATRTLVVASDEPVAQYCVPWRVAQEFTWYIHKGFTKRVTVLRQ